MWVRPGPEACIQRGGGGEVAVESGDCSQPVGAAHRGTQREGGQGRTRKGGPPAPHFLTPVVPVIQLTLQQRPSVAIRWKTPPWRRQPHTSFHSYLLFFHSYLLCPFLSLICSSDGLLLGGNRPPGAASSSCCTYDILGAVSVSMKCECVSTRSMTRGGGAPSNGCAKRVGDERLKPGLVRHQLHIPPLHVSSPGCNLVP